MVAAAAETVGPEDAVDLGRWEEPLADALGITGQLAGRGILGALRENAQPAVVDEAVAALDVADHVQGDDAVDPPVLLLHPGGHERAADEADLFAREGHEMDRRVELVAAEDAGHLEQGGDARAVVVDARGRVVEAVAGGARGGAGEGVVVGVDEEDPLLPPRTASGEHGHDVAQGDVPPEAAALGGEVVGVERDPEAGAQTRELRVEPVGGGLDAEAVAVGGQDVAGREGGELAEDGLDVVARDVADDGVDVRRRGGRGAARGAGRRGEHQDETGRGHAGCGVFHRASFRDRGISAGPIA